MKDLVKLVGSYDLDANANRKSNGDGLEVLEIMVMLMERSPDNITSVRPCLILVAEVSVSKSIQSLVHLVNHIQYHSNLSTLLLPFGPFRSPSA